MTRTLIFAPMLPVWALWVLAVLTLVLTGLALWRGLRGWPLRGLSALALLAALTGPSLQEEDRKPLHDVVILAVDRSSSQGLSDRTAQTDAAVQAVRDQVAALPGTDLHEVAIPDGPQDTGTRAMSALAEALAQDPQARVAGEILITDGQVHDLDAAPDLPAPLNVLLTGHPQDWDRRLTIKSAPAFAILGEEVQLSVRIDESGAAPKGDGQVQLTIALDDNPPQTYSVPVGQDLTLPVTLPHAGSNVLQFSVPAAAGELTDRNNAAVVDINGVRDRLRVLLVSGEPHAGERVWRNLLKSDPSVDLVHFTILRPPEKQDGTPVSELSLIAFPTRELFVDKIKSFDLIIFDRYAMRGILPMSYIDNVVQYVKDGGTVLVAAGPEFAGVDSLYRTPLAEILPVAPTAQVVEGGFRPALTDLGRRHPVTEGLDKLAPKGGWGRWFRLVELTVLRGQVVMKGANDLPLLVLDRVGQGRVAVLASDQAWLWGRGYEGGGPLIEMLRRLAHWMLKEPELEEENLTAVAEAGVLKIERRTVADSPPGPVTVTAPDGSTTVVPLTPDTPGRYVADYKATALGLYRLKEGDLTRVVALGTATPREFENPLATGDLLAPIAGRQGGGVTLLSAGQPDIRTVRAGRPAIGRGWIGITPRGAYVTGDLHVTPLFPAALWLILAALALVAAWLIEGRRPKGPGPA
jgi:hypothetical protein